MKGVESLKAILLDEASRFKLYEIGCNLVLVEDQLKDRMANGTWRTTPVQV